MFHAYATPLQLDLKASRILTAIRAGIVLLLGLALVRIHHPVIILLGGAMLFAWYRYKAATSPTPQRIVWGQERHVQLVYGDTILNGQLSAPPLSNWLFTRLAMRMENGKTRYQMVYADGLAPDQYRKLRVRAKLERQLAKQPEPF